MIPPTAILGSPVRRSVPLGGGAARVELADGRTVVVKDGPGVAAEAAGLRWLAVRAGRRCRRCSRTTARGSSPSTSRRDGRRQLRRPSSAGGSRRCTRCRGAPAFGPGPPGTAEDAWIGRAPMRNVPAAGVGTVVRRRTGSRPTCATARDAGDLTADEAAVIERVCDSAAGAGRPARAAGAAARRPLVGQRAVGDGRGLADRPRRARRAPGDRPRDAGAVRLPPPDTVLAAYDEAAPLAPGWRDRVPLHQLFPLLVHVVLFGRGYAGQCVAAARAALGSR